MTASYPSTVKSFTTKVDFSDTVFAAHVNDLQDEVNSVQANLGTAIRVSSGWIGSFDQVTTTWNSLKDRIANIEYGLNEAFIARVPGGGTTGQVLQKNSGTNYDYSWTTFTGLPSQTGNSGYYLTTDGSSASWAAVTTGTSVPDTFSQFLLAGC